MVKIRIKIYKFVCKLKGHIWQTSHTKHDGTVHTCQRCGMIISDKLGFQGYR